MNRIEWHTKVNHTGEFKELPGRRRWFKRHCGRRIILVNVYHRDNPERVAFHSFLLDYWCCEVCGRTSGTFGSKLEPPSHIT